MYVVWKKRPLKGRHCPRCWASAHAGQWSWIPVIVESRRVNGSPRQMHVLRLPAIRDCCIRDAEARAEWWEEVELLLGRFGSEADRLWERLAGKVPLATRAAKRSFTLTEDLPLHEGYRYEQSQTVALASTEDTKEAQRAFAEKRKPVFKGR